MRSVTTIIGRLFPFPKTIPKHVLETARQRGTSIHEWIEGYNNEHITGEVCEGIDFPYVAYADNYIDWFTEYEVEPILSEVRTSWNGVTGQIDLLCKTKDHEKCLVSFKATYAINVPYCELQESAYNRLLIENDYLDEVVPKYVLHLKKDGYVFKELSDQEDVFWKLVEIDKYLEEHGK